MTALFARVSVLCVVAGATITSVNSSLAADTHTIIGTQQVNWTYNGQKSTPTTPLVVDDLKVGDIVEIQIPKGPIPHGFVTITKGANSQQVESRDLVVACGEDKNAKPNAVLQEGNCGAASQFGVIFQGSMQLTVLPSFKDPVDFWCVVHHGRMSGTLKLKP
jgi:hypothetical protein